MPLYPPSVVFTPGAARQKLTGNLDIYVNGSTGNDNNPGTITLPFATIQKGVDTLAGYDGNGFIGTVHVADGTYAPTTSDNAVTLPELVGFGLNSGSSSTAFLVGNTTTPANCVIDGTNAAFTNVLAATGPDSLWHVAGFTLTGTSCWGMVVDDYAQLRYDALVFDGNKLLNCVVAGPLTFVSSDYGGVGVTITAGSTIFDVFQISGLSLVNDEAVTTFVGNPSFTNFVSLTQLSWFFYGGSSVGSCTGKKYVATVGSHITTGGTIPGSTAGTVDPTSTYNGVVGDQVAHSKSGAPTTSDVADGTWSLWKDTGGGTVKLWYNDGGSMKSVALT